MSLRRCNNCGTDYDDNERNQFCPHERRDQTAPRTSSFEPDRHAFQADPDQAFAYRRENAQLEQQSKVLILGDRIIEALDRVTFAMDNLSTLLIRAEHRGGYSK